MQQRKQLAPEAIERSRWVIFISVCLIAAGLVWVESASYPLASAPDRAIDAFAVFKRQLAVAVIALAAMLTFAYMPGRRWLAAAGHVGLLASLVWMAAVLKFGDVRHGTKAWLYGQPSEFAKVFLVLFGAYVLSQRPVRTILQRNVAMYLAAVGIVAVLLRLQHDIGMLMLVALSALAVLFIAGTPLLDLFAVGAIGAAGAAWLILHDPVRLVRITSWLWPMEHLDRSGYHVMSSLIAIARGRGFGLLPGGSPDKWYALPYPATDSIFCVIAAESGLWGTALLLLAFGALLVYALLAAHAATSEYDRIAALGCGLLLTIQAAVHMGVAVNFLPATGLTLPFMSAGGSSLIASAIAAGVIANVARRGRGRSQEWVFA